MFRLVVMVLLLLLLLALPYSARPENLPVVSPPRRGELSSQSGSQPRLVGALTRLGGVVVQN